MDMGASLWLETASAIVEEAENVVVECRNQGNQRSKLSTGRQINT